MIIIYILLALIITFIMLFILGGWILSAPAYKGPETDHFNGRRFLNHEGARAKGFKDIIRWMMSGERRPKWNPRPSSVILERIVDYDITGQAKTYFINHSSFLIQTQGINFLTDPIYSEYASPFQWAGPKRMCPPGVDISALPRIDYILLSHNHYDHLDLQTLLKIREKFDPVIVCPLGVDQFLKRKGFTRLQVLDWWESADLEDFTVSAVPAQHFSARGMFDRDRTLWCGYVLEVSNLKIYYVGDTGYGNIFKKIGEQYGPMDLSIIPIGAYRPRWFMSPIHCDPSQALRIHHDVNSRMSIPCHFGTFPLAMDGQTEPLDELTSLSEYKEIQKQFVVLKEGEYIEIRNPKKNESNN